MDNLRSVLEYAWYNLYLDYAGYGIFDHGYDGHLNMIDYFDFPVFN